MRVDLTRQEKKDLYFILFQFIDTHISSVDIYKGEIKIARKIIKKIIK